MPSLEIYRGWCKMANIQVKISDEIIKEVNSLIKLGLYKNEVEVMETALKKMFAEQSRDYLRNLAKERKISKKEMIREWEKIRK